MIKNYFKIAWRNLIRQIRFTLLNVIGLSIGITAVLLIFQIVQFESSFNKNYKNYDRIVRVVGQRVGENGETTYQTGMATSAMISTQQLVSQFEASSRIRMYRPTIIVPNSVDQDSKREENGQLKKINLSDDGVAIFVEPSFPKIFDLEWLAGDKLRSLNDLNSVILSKSMAEKCFNTFQNSIGKTIILDNVAMTVNAVIGDAPANCDFPIEILLPYATLVANKEKYDYVENWGRNRGNDQMFALLTKPVVFAAANTVVGQIGKKEYASASNSKQIGTNTHFLEPLSDLHFDSRFFSSSRPMIARSRLWILSSIGLLVLLMACFNFISLSTAQSLRRAKEVGIRKTLGSNKGSLFGQFITETGLIVLFSIALGTILTKLVSPVLNQISNLPKELPYFSNPMIWLFLGFLTVIITLLSGIYPSMVLTQFSPVRALKSEVLTKQLGSGNVRKSLVVFQFVITQVLLISTIVSLRQMNFIQNIDLGFNKDLIYNFGMDNTPESRLKFNTMKTEILKISGVESMTMSNLPPASLSSWQTSFTVGEGTSDQPFNTGYMFADADFQKTFDVKLLAGRWYRQSDTTAGYVINETLMKKVGISSPDKAIGQILRLERDPWSQIIGVVKDFHSKPLQSGFEPLVLASYLDLYVGSSVKINSKNIASTIESIKNVFDKTYPEQVFRGGFFDENIARFYASETRFTQTCKGFALLAILISCLGLFGLVSLMTEQRTKEIGIRKVLGATVTSIIGLISKDFLILVSISILIGSPIAYYFMSKWLQVFTYRIDISWWIFVASGLGALAVTLLTVSYQAIKAAMMNPVKSLKTE